MVVAAVSQGILGVACTYYLAFRHFLYTLAALPLAAIKQVLTAAVAIVVVVVVVAVLP